MHALLYIFLGFLCMPDAVHFVQTTYKIFMMLKELENYDFGKNDIIY